jgi:hypothetical protein
MLEIVCLIGSVVGVCLVLVYEGFQVCPTCFVETLAHKTAWLECVAHLCRDSHHKSWKDLYYEKADLTAMAPQRKDDVKEKEMLRNQLQRHTVEQEENIFILKKEAT